MYGLEKPDDNNLLQSILCGWHQTFSQPHLAFDPKRAGRVGRSLRENLLGHSLGFEPNSDICSKTIMPSIPLHPTTSSRSPTTSNPFPPLIQTPSGVALLEIQGTLHTPSSNQDVTRPSSLDHSLENSALHETSVGRIVFPHYNPSLLGEEDLSWMKRVYLYVGKHQRLTGEVKKLGKPVAVLRKRIVEEKTDRMVDMEDKAVSEEAGEELEIVEIVRFKILFAGRPEPVDE